MRDKKVLFTTQAAMIASLQTYTHKPAEKERSPYLPQSAEWEPQIYASAEDMSRLPQVKWQGFRIKYQAAE